MALPIRRATPQKPVRRAPVRRVTPAPVAGPQPKPTFALAAIQKVRRPLYSVTKRVVPAAVPPIASAVLPIVGGVSNPTGKVSELPRWPKYRVLVSRLVVAAPVAGPQPSATVARQGVKRPIVKNRTSRRLTPASVAVNLTPINVKGTKRLTPKNAASRLIAAAPAAGPQSVPTFAAAPGTATGSPRAKIARWAKYRVLPSRIVTAAPVAPAQPKSTNVSGVRRGIVKSGVSHRLAAVAPALPLSPIFVSGVRRGPTRPGKPRLVIPAPIAPAQPASTNVSGVKRGPTKNNRSRFFVGIAPSVPLPVIVNKGIKRGPTAPGKPRLLKPAPVAGPGVPATFAKLGVRRTAPLRRLALSRFLVAPAQPAHSPGKVGAFDKAVNTVGVADRNVSTVGAADKQANTVGVKDRAVSTTGAADKQVGTTGGNTWP